MKQMQSPHLHKASFNIKLISNSSAVIQMNTDLAGTWLSTANFKQLSYVYDRYRVIQCSAQFNALAPIQGAGQTPLLVRYNPTDVANPPTAEYITDALNSKSFNPNKLSPSTFTFVPKFSLPPLMSGTEAVTSPDQDGFLPFSIGSLGFATPFLGCLQYFQSVTSSYGDPEWSVILTFFVECVYPC